MLYTITINKMFENIGLLPYGLITQLFSIFPPYQSTETLIEYNSFACSFFTPSVVFLFVKSEDCICSGYNVFVKRLIKD